MNTKEDFSHCISTGFFRSSAWRHLKKRAFPGDARNERAANRLLELESQIEVSDDQWKRFEPHCREQNLLAAITDTNRDVCFRTYPRDFAAWLENLHANLTAN